MSGATTSVLTGTLLVAPDPLESYVGYHARRDKERVVLKVHPAIPPSYVQQAYRETRARALGGRRERLQGEDSLKLAAFLLDEPEGPSWERRMEHWNEAHPERRYLDRRLFYRDGSRALRAIEELAGESEVVKEESGGEARQ